MSIREQVRAVTKLVDGQHLYWENDVMMIFKKDENVEWKEKPACKDPNYKGNRYIWISEIETFKNVD